MQKLLIILSSIVICTIFVPHDAFAKNITVKLFESMTLDSGDAKPDDKNSKKKDTKKDTKKKDTKKKEKKDTKKKLTKAKGKPPLKTKHDTVKNSIGNIR